MNDPFRACIQVLPEAEGWRLAVKDNMDVAGTVRTDGLRPPNGPPATRDAEAVRRLRAAGAVVVAKTNLEELSTGATTQNDWWGSCRNPWDPSRLPGGSSGGSAVAVAAGMADVALGTDTGGSARNPAALCGISALRTSIGLVPFDGISDLAPEFDAIGPMARGAEELGRMLAALTPGARPAPRGLSGVRVGIPEDFFHNELHEDVAVGVQALQLELADAGAVPVPLRLRGAADTQDALGVLLNAQAADLHPHWLDDDRVADKVRDRLLSGRRATTSERASATRVAERWRVEVAAAFDDVDVLLVPTVPIPAPPIDDTHMVEVSRRLNRFNAAWSLARLPALTIPCPLGAAGLPVGAQFVGRHGDDWLLVDVAAAVQRRTDWHEARPPGC